MYNTKDKILNASIRLFNEYGVASVRLQQIADETGISVGNLAYHYKNKEAILSSVYDRIFNEFSEILSKYLQNPSFLDFDVQVSAYFNFFEDYQFYISDLFSKEHAVPEIKLKWQQFMNKMILQINRRIDFYVSQGDLRPEPSKDTYLIVSEAMWMSIVFWIPQQTMRNKPISEKRYKEALWSHLKPYFTQKGNAQFSDVILPILVK
ncbi:TetR/AcrR family transcriptional regulator [Arcicella rigui]|uniref:TetR/AcrR family transcriptional regulator n=1 Tax=Arcicella rigui TaxID=797020 RepID=A0ABU5Q7V6_9BACT|nr:TetR/AcrR family transcriptional regulator [Arcicella rigui]MEA5138657.1 TetR/AcrR family transcriptional regulator [Arcicella rigui]